MTEGIVLAKDMQQALMLGFAALIILGVISIAYFVWRIKLTLNEFFTFVVVFLIMLSIPVTVFTVFYRQNIVSRADRLKRIENVILSLRPGNIVLLSITTSTPEIVYLEYKDNSSGKVQIILPLYSVESREINVFKFSISSSGGEAVPVVSGQRQLVDGKPIIIRP